MVKVTEFSTTETWIRLMDGDCRKCTYSVCASPASGSDQWRRQEGRGEASPVWVDV